MQCQTKSILVAAGILGVLPVGCTSGRPSHELFVSEPAVTAEADGAPGQAAAPLIIGYLKGREHTITLHSAVDGPRFTIATNDGKVLGSELTLEQVRAQLPDIYDSIKSNFAASSATMDASVRVPVAGPMDAGIGER